MKIGILTFHRAYNCGAMLQAWALKTVLERMGHVVSFPKCNRVGETTRWQPWYRQGSRGVGLVRSFCYRSLVNLLSIGADGLSQKRYRDFRHRYLPEDDFQRNRIGDSYDLLVFGSDQIWRPALCTEEERDVFFLRGFGDGVKKITYAASYDDKPLMGADAEMLRVAAGKFDMISVRERLVADQLKALTNKDYPVVLDPTLLLTSEDYQTVKSNDRPSGDYLFVYVLFATPFIVKTAREVAKRMGLKLILTPVYQYSRFGAPLGLTYGISPDRLVSYIENARYVMSYSFHGTVFSLLFKKNFVDLRPIVDKFETRTASLLRQLDIQDRIANPETSIDDIVKMLRTDLPYDYMDRLAVLRRQSAEWLRNAVEGIEGQS